MRVFRSFFGLILAILLVVFAVANRQVVPLIYSPVHDPLSVPLYLVALSFMGGGFILGGFIVWANGGKSRKASRKQRKAIKELEKELKNVQAAPLKTASPPPGEFFPALPAKENSSIKQG